MMIPINGRIGVWTMKQMLILGAGTGGALIANKLSHELDLKEWSIKVIDKSDQHVYQAGLLFLPFKLYGYDEPSDVVKPIVEPVPRSVELIRAEIKAIDPQRRNVETADGDYSYDLLVSAMGCRIAPEEIDGMQEAWGNRVHTFYTLEGAIAFQSALDQMTEGRLVINIADGPIKCPVAPIEFAFLADYYFHQRGIRDHIDITLVTPFSGAFTKPNANRILSKIAEEKRINIVPDFTIERVDGDNNQISSFEGGTVGYDLLCAIPPNFGPQVVDESGLGDGTGYGLSDPRTLKSKKADHIYFLGDNSNVSASKAGSVTHFEAETVVENLLREIQGKAPMPSFDGHANCFIESGYHKALLIDFNYDMEPLEGSFPLPYAGPFSLLEETYMNHVGKIAFKWVYWNMLLPGRLPNVPLMPAHMSFLGKDLNSAPQIRRAREMRIRDVMTKEVITVRQGTSLTEAARQMIQHNISSLPVVDVDDRLIGILTEADFLSAMDVAGGGLVRDLFETIITRRRTRKKMGTIVDDIMTADPITIGEDERLQTAIALMDNNKVKRLIITDTNKRVTGIISRPDVVKLFAMK